MSGTMVAPNSNQTLLILLDYYRLCPTKEPTLTNADNSATNKTRENSWQSRGAKLV